MGSHHVTQASLESSVPQLGISVSRVKASARSKAPCAGVRGKPPSFVMLAPIIPKVMEVQRKAFLG